MKTLSNFIAGRWVPAEGGGTLEDTSPANRERICRFPDSTPKDAARAVEAAAAAYPAWREVPAPKRGELLFKVARVLEKKKDELARLMTREMGKVLTEARGDVQEAIDISYYMAGEGRRQSGQTVPSEMPNKLLMTTRAPLGVFSLITPWNFPVAIPSWKMLPCLVLGNTCVLKPAEDTPACASAFVEAFEEAGVPAGVVNLVHGRGERLGKTLVTHPKVAGVSFTGSTAVGKLINAQAAPLLKRVCLEMGGKNPIIVMDDADLDLAVDAILWAAFGTSGQRCTAASRVVVHRPVKRPLEERLVERAGALRLGDGLDPRTQLGPVVNARQLERIDRYVQIGIRKDKATLLCGGAPAREGVLRKGSFYRPTVFTDVTPRMTIAQEEIFGPVTCLMPVDTFEEAIQVANATRYGLSSSIFTGDVGRACRAAGRLETGLVYVNHGTTGAEVSTPFGGMKETGNGHRESGQAALDTFSEWKTVAIDYSGRLQRAQID